MAEAKEQTIKLAIRLNEGINEALRTLIRYRGDLSTMALEALDAVDLTRAALVSAEERMVRDTTITMPRVLHKKLKKIADDRDSSMNILVNTALDIGSRKRVRCGWDKAGICELGEDSMNAHRPRGLFLDSANHPQQDQKTLATREELFARTLFGLKPIVSANPN